LLLYKNLVLPYTIADLRTYTVFHSNYCLCIFIVLSAYNGFEMPTIIMLDFSNFKYIIKQRKYFFHILLLNTNPRKFIKI